MKNGNFDHYTNIFFVTKSAFSPSPPKSDSNINKTERTFSLKGHEEYDMTCKFFKSDYVF